MFKKILVLIVLSVFVSCGTSRSRVATTKKSSTKTRAHSNTRKPVTTTRNNTATKNTQQKEVLESTSKTVVYADLVKQYILDFKDIAKDNMKRHGIPASITLAQGILESGAGRGTLCVTANNHFGIKCHTGWTGETIHHDDDAEQECFRKYKLAAESYNDHSLFLTTRGRYASLFELPKNDYVAWAHGLKKAGYATDPKYPDKLIGLIERYNLADYDAEVIGSSYKPVPRASDAPKMNQNEAPVAMDSHQVVKGDTLYSISKKHNLTVEQLMELNGLKDNSISIGQVLKVK
jgi:flagellum-specific peptidoglycan hydrolase FlgJ